MQLLDGDFILSRHRLQGYIAPGLGVAEIYGDPGMSGSPILGTCCDIPADGTDADGEVVGLLRGGMGERMLRITFITGDVINQVAWQAGVDQQINWI